MGKMYMYKENNNFKMLCFSQPFKVFILNCYKQFNFIISRIFVMKFTCYLKYYLLNWKVQELTKYNIYKQYFLKAPNKKKMLFCKVW